MRLFEILLLVGLTPLVMWPLLPLRRPRWLDGLALLALAFLTAHLIWEGWRWQMIPAYGLTAVYSLTALYHFIKRDWKLEIGQSLISNLLYFFALFTLLIAFALPALLPVPKMLPMTGPYAVGTFSLDLVDNGREEIYTPENGDPREVMAQFWYPAVPTGKEEEAVYLQGLDVAGPVLAEQFDLPAFMFNHINLTKTGVWQDAPAADGRFPLIIFSHGLTGLRVQNSSMARELASQGYVVAAIDHTYGNALTVFPDGRVVVYDPCRLFTNCDANYIEANPLIHQWSDDIAFLLDTISMWDETTSGILAGKIDMEHIGVFGHSTGGGTAVQFCMDDTRCDAGIGLDAWVLPVDERVLDTPPPQPFLFISSPVWLGKENQARGRAILQVLPNDSEEITLENTEHFDFSDLPLFSPLTPQLGLSGTIDSMVSQKTQIDYISAFFNQHVRNNEQ
ncbi:MAG: hypothetical protein H6662_03135 [Ardenticatenaceae bacterium]|nr:hypothetical protein [Anaerolineales bacterium]MCB8920555.1 hypothetical protein [Ardenticatenaceae bacterium]MCB8990178.1 hypothetical protein [Ardenticatenaceae bacterium]MCB9003031.1 hypothetical protein [Ardenticatenaceae bacterium]